jgi:hypothetical protein
MALKLLNPGLRPLGMFDLDDSHAGAVNGGEYVQLKTEAAVGAEGYAADVGQLEDVASIVNFELASRTAGRLGGLADEGGEEYGTLFGSLIGSNAGKATLVSGAVVLGPTTDRASGKVTVWAQAGLYGVNGQNDAELTAAAANTAIHASGAGVLQTTAGGTDQVAIYVGAMSDSSLVSTTNTAAGEAATTEYHAVFFTGNAQA